MRRHTALAPCLALPIVLASITGCGIEPCCHSDPVVIIIEEPVPIPRWPWPQPRPKPPAPTPVPAPRYEPITQADSQQDRPRTKTPRTTRDERRPVQDPKPGRTRGRPRTRS